MDNKQKLHYVKVVLLECHKSGCKLENEKRELKFIACRFCHNSCTTLLKQKYTFGVLLLLSHIALL